MREPFDRMVTAPDGTTWQVSIRWLMRAPRWGGLGASPRLPGAADPPEEGTPDDDAAPSSASFPEQWMTASQGDVSGTMGGIAIVVLLVLGIVLVALPLVGWILDALFLVIVAVLAVAIRVLLRRPWRIDLEETGRRRNAPEREWNVVGWRASRRAIAHVAEDLARGVAPGSVEPPLDVGAQKVR